MKRTVLLVVLAALAVSATLGAPAWADDEKVHKIVIRSACEGDDCDQHRAVFLDEGGIATELEGGEGHTWLHRDGAGLLQRIHALSGGFLGVQLTDLTPELRSHFGVPEDAGVLVGSVVPDSAAAAAGLAVGDIITEVGGHPVTSAGELSRQVRHHEAGDAIELEVWSGASVRTVTATLGERPAPEGLHRARVLKLDCDGDEEECGARFLHGLDLDLDCESGDCGITVECDDGECTCEVNGEVRDCSELEGVHVLPG